MSFVLKWPPQSPDLNPIEHLWDVVEREIRALDIYPKNLHQHAIVSIWANISKESFQPLVESMSHKIKAVLKAKRVKHSISVVFLIILQGSEHFLVKVHYFLAWAAAV